MTKVGEVDLRSGRRLYLRELRLFETYEGLLEGYPTAERNKQQIERLIAENHNSVFDSSPYLISPTETPIEYAGKYPFGTPSALPTVTCVGRFESLEPSRDKSCDGSGLVIVWFQNEFAFPIDSDVAAQLLHIDWDSYAYDWSY